MSRAHDSRYQAYLDQLHLLGEFRQVHAERHSGVAIGEDDPAVQRIIEALAYFSVGTQLAAENNMRASLERLLSGYFDFLLSPMPAMGLLQLTGTERLLESAALGEDVPLLVTAPDGSMAQFRTMHELPLAPVQLEHTEVIVLEDGFRLLVPLRAQYPVRNLVGPLHLRVHYLDRFVSSLRLVHNLKRHLRGVSAFFDARPTDGRPGVPCNAELGAVTSGATLCTNPLERVRLLLHYPEIELAAQVTVPPSSRGWTRLVLAFDLDSKWPDARVAAQDPFVLHAVPVANLRRAPAAVIECEGLRIAHPLVPNEPENNHQLASVVGVYALEQSHNGLVPILPASLPNAVDGYEIERVRTQSGCRYQIHLRFADSFTRPRRIAVDADWYQPWFSDRAVGPLKVLFSDRHMEGVQLRMLGMLRRHSESPLAALSSALLELLAMRMKPTLSKDELVAVMRLLGVDDESPFAPLLPRIRALSVDSTPDVGIQAARHRYRLQIESIPPGDEAITWTLMARIRETLEAWSDGAVVAVDVDVAEALQSNQRENR